MSHSPYVRPRRLWLVVLLVALLATGGAISIVLNAFTLSFLGGSLIGGAIVLTVLLAVYEDFLKRKA